MATSPPSLVLPSRERLARLIDYAVQGAWPPSDCNACTETATGRCGECARLEDDAAALGRILIAVQVAPSEGDAREAILAGLAELAAGGAR